MQLQSVIKIAREGSSLSIITPRDLTDAIVSLELKRLVGGLTSSEVDALTRLHVARVANAEEDLVGFRADAAAEEAR